MAKKIDKLTPQQEIDLVEWKEKYLTAGLSTEPANRQQAESAFAEAYKLSGKRPPKVVVWVDSPAEANKLISKSLGKEKVEYNSTYFWGQVDLYWIAFYQFCAHIGCKYKDDDQKKLDVMEKIGHSCFWWWPYEHAVIASERPIEIHMQDRRRLHNETGPCVKFRDGFAIYAIKGVRVPDFVVNYPEKITIKDIDNASNAEVKRIMIERFGSERYLKESGAELVHSLPDNYFVKGLQNAKLWRKNRENDTPIIMIECINSTPEPDGSIKHYWIRVDPRAYNGEAGRHCHAAMASTWRVHKDLYFKDWRHYAPCIET